MHIDIGLARCKRRFNPLSSRFRNILNVSESFGPEELLRDKLGRLADARDLDEPELPRPAAARLRLLQIAIPKVLPFQPQPRS